MVHGSRDSPLMAARARQLASLAWRSCWSQSIHSGLGGWVSGGRVDGGRARGGRIATMPPVQPLKINPMLRATSGLVHLLLESEGCLQILDSLGLPPLLIRRHAPR